MMKRKRVKVLEQRNGEVFGLIMRGIYLFSSADLEGLPLLPFSNWRTRNFKPEIEELEQWSKTNTFPDDEDEIQNILDSLSSDEELQGRNLLQD